jgi:hypothetical protein
MPCDHPEVRNIRRSSKGYIYDRAELTMKIKLSQFAPKLNVSAQSLIQALLSIFLAKNSKCMDVTVGSLFSLRQDSRLGKDIQCLSV